MSTRATVYVIDDDDSFRDSLPSAIAARGYQIKGFASAEDFLLAYDGNSPGCMLLDMRMPKMNGLSLQEEMARRQWTLPIIFLSGFGTVPMVAKAMKAGAFDFYEKPIEPAQLIKSIKEAILVDQKHRLKNAQRRDVESRMARLTPRQREVMDLVVQGFSSKQIAKRLGRSIKTVEVHRSQILLRMNVRGVAELINLVLGK